MAEPTPNNRRKTDPTYNLLWALLQFKGRMNREEYWWANGALFGVTLLMFYAIFGSHIAISETNEILLPDHMMSQFFLIMLASIYVTLAISVKRLHDIGAPGFVAVVFVFPFIGVIAFVLLGLFKGQQKDNKYGPQPPH